MPQFAFPDRFFVTGTDTDVGKTVVSALLAAGLGASYWKPVQCGLEGLGGDRDRVAAWAGLTPDRVIPERYRLEAPLSPHLASRLEQVQINLQDFQLPEVSGSLIVEGAGGLLVPLNEQDLILDLIRQLQLPVVLVARSKLGTINHTLLSIAALRAAEVSILGVIVNGPRNPENCAAIAHYGQVPILAELEPLPALNPQVLKDTFNQLFHA